MNCHDVEDILLQVDAPEAHQGAAVEAHLAACQHCRTFRQRLVRLENIVRELPACPASAIPPLRRTAPLPNHRRHVSGWRVAVAAAMLIGIGTAVWVYQSQDQQAVAGPELIQQLAVWNVELAEENSLDVRARRFTQSEARMKKKLERARLSPAEQKLAQSMFDNGAWIARHRDELAEAERFDVVARGLIDHLGAAAHQGSPATLDKLGGAYTMVVDRGIKKKLAKLETAGVTDPEQKGKLARAKQAHAERQKKLKSIVDRSPAGSKKKILKVLDQTAD